MTRLFLLALAVLLAGYMFMGRGFAHVAIGPAYVGEWVLALAAVAGLVVAIRRGVSPLRTWTIGILIVFMLLGAVRTIPYVGAYGLDALRDAVLWAYGMFAVVISLVLDRALVKRATTTYGWIVIAFALWLPVCWNIFTASQAGIDTTRPGSNHPLVFFKAGDMAVHSVAAIGFLVLAPTVLPILARFALRVAVAIPLTWAVFLTGAASRGALLGATAGLGVTVLSTRRPRNWLPVALAAFIVVIWLNAPTIISLLPTPSPSPSSSPTESATPSTSPGPTPGRAPSVGQLVENVWSIIGSSSRSDLDGTKAFRLAWWSKIADYTVFGPYFWTGKGFGLNLADDDGFQPTLDHSLRAPHNSHMSILARMGVPGLALWVLLQGAFVLGMLRAIRTNRRDGDAALAGVGAWVLIIWAAMMVVTSFDPYLEGPQGGIWYWCIFGLGLATMRLASRPATATA